MGCMELSLANGNNTPQQGRWRFCSEQFERIFSVFQAIACDNKFCGVSIVKGCASLSPPPLASFGNDVLKRANHCVS